MKKVFTLLTLVAFMIVLSGCDWFKKDDTNGEEQEVFTGSVEDLLAKNDPVKCEYSFDNGTDKISGTVYVADGKARSDFDILENLREYQTHFISDGEYMYNWSTFEPGGIKLKIMDYDYEGTEADVDVKQEFEYSKFDQEYEYNCTKWKKDESMFVPPSHVEFTDLTEQMEEINEQLEQINSGNQNLCDTCNLLGTEQERQDCRESLNCD